MEKKYYASFKCDINDADFITEIVELDENEVKTLKHIISKLLPYRSTTRWDKGIPFQTQDMVNSRDPRDGNFYINQNVLNQEQVDFMEDCLPYGDGNYPGIHTISSIVLFEKVEDIL